MRGSIKRSEGLDNFARGSRISRGVRAGPRDLARTSRGIWGNQNVYISVARVCFSFQKCDATIVPRSIEKRIRRYPWVQNAVYINCIKEATNRKVRSAPRIVIDVGIISGAIRVALSCKNAICLNPKPKPKFDQLVN